MTTYRDNYNINVKYVLCPYDKNHKIPANRLPKHLISCEKKSEKVLIMCPFNGSHRLTKDQIEEHIMKCRDQSSIIFEQIITVSEPLEDNNNSNEVKDEENWDKKQI